jgi:hypothetical protein
LAELKKHPPGKAEDTHRSYLHDDVTVVILQFGQTKDVKLLEGLYFPCYNKQTLNHQRPLFRRMIDPE